ncbi:MAG: zinc-ribbon domain-containing protein [Erysipelotrichaceae bacterium]|nr:zinc-ribbon domain-containing protein [Erysipelotrichaceae bacterium]
MKTLKKIISILLATLSLLMLFMPWVSLRNKEDMNAMFIDELGYYYNIDSYTELKNGLRKLVKEELQDFADEVREDNIKVNVNDLLKIYDYVIDYKVNPNEADYIASKTAPLLKKITQYLDKEVVMFADEEDLKMVSAMKQAALGLNVYHGLYIASFVAFALAVLAILTDRFKIAKFLNFLVRLVMVAATATGVFFFNRYIDTQPYPAYLAVLKITVWPILALLLALPDGLYLGIIDKLAGSIDLKPALANVGNKVRELKPVLENAGNKVKEEVSKIPTGDLKNTFKSVSGGWVCPDCGSRNGASSRFCSNCGKVNPNIVVCPSCGKELKEHEAYCPDCGTSIEWPATDITCPNCGKKNALGSAFCENCGQKLS